MFCSLASISPSVLSKPQDKKEKILFHPTVVIPYIFCTICITLRLEGSVQYTTLK